MTDISDRLVNIERESENQRETFTTYFQNINVNFDKKTSELVYKDYLGNVYRMHIESLVDNDSIRYNEENALELKYKPDNETIERESVETNDSSWKGIIKVTGIKYKETVRDEVTGEITEKEKTLTGKQLAENQVAVDTRFKVIEKSLDDIASYVKGDSYQGQALEPISLANIYLNVPASQQTLAIQNSLNKHACDQLQVTSQAAFPDNLKVLETYKGELWIFTKPTGSTTGSWKNNGKDLIVSATNDGVYGVVTGVEWENNDTYKDSWETNYNYLKGHILSELKSDNTMTAPTFTLNGLKERLTDLDQTKVEKLDNSSNSFDVVYIQKKNTNGKEQQVNHTDYLNVSDGIENNQIAHIGNSIVKRTDSGTIIANNPTELDEVSNLRFISTNFSGLSSKIGKLANTTYPTDWITNNGDVTTVSNFIDSVRTGV